MPQKPVKARRTEKAAKILTNGRQSQGLSRASSGHSGGPCLNVERKQEKDPVSISSHLMYMLWHTCVPTHRKTHTHTQKKT